MAKVHRTLPTLAVVCPTVPSIDQSLPSRAKYWADSARSCQTKAGTRLCVTTISQTPLELPGLVPPSGPGNNLPAGLVECKLSRPRLCQLRQTRDWIKGRSTAMVNRFANRFYQPATVSPIPTTSDPIQHLVVNCPPTPPFRPSNITALPSIHTIRHHKFDLIRGRIDNNKINLY